MRRDPLPPPPLAKVIRGPWRAPEPRWHVALEVVCALVALATAGAFFGAAVGMLP